MAVAAETDTYRLVDSIPEVALERQQVRTHAESLLAQRRESAPEVGADTGQELLPVDALSTAHGVLEAFYMYGEDSPEHIERSRGLVLDCQRLVGEWYRKKKPEYFSPIRHVFNEATEEFFSHGLSIRQMTENALTPIADDPEEEGRRVNERVEDATPQILRRLGGIAIGTEAIRTISECTDQAIQDYTYDLQNDEPHRGYRGYVPEIEKFMIRDIQLDPYSNDRFEVQVAVPGIYIDREVIRNVLGTRGVAAAGMDKTTLHGSQMIVHDGPFEFLALLDEAASQRWSSNIFMGEVVPADHPKDYDAFRQEALQRQKDLKDIAETVATFVLDLAEDGFDRRKAPVMVEEFVKFQLLTVGKHDKAVAEQMFDAQTAEGLQQVAYLESIGQNRQAFELMQQVTEAAPGGGFCGAGSCGLEAVDLSSDEGKELAKKLNAKPGDTVLKDKERACRCGNKTIVYAYNKDKIKGKVNKYCDTCGASESKPGKLTAAA